ncbi:MAG: hypothetical protein ACRYHQ_29920 [Janthinobacterium lividum]
MAAAVARLWCRAPAWRSLLVLALALTIVARLTEPWERPRVQAQAASLSQYTPALRAALLKKARHVLVTVADRVVPLPSGTWATIVIATWGVNPQLDSELFIQTAGNRVTGIVMVEGSVTPGAASGAIPIPQGCVYGPRYRSWTVSTEAGTRECWGIGAMFPPTDWRAGHSHFIFTGALDKLREAGFEVPPTMVVASWYHADATNWTSMAFLFDPASDSLAPTQPSAWTPDAVTASPGAMRFVERVAAWCNRWTPLVEAGTAEELSRSRVVSTLTSQDPNVF